MSSLSQKRDIFKELLSFLITTGKLDQKDADIYVLALKKGVIKSSDVSDEFSDVRPSTAITRMNRLAKKGFLEVLPKETTRRRPYAVKFRAIHPKIALEEVVEKAIALPKLLELYDEHWEFLAEKAKLDSEMWLAKSQKAAIGIGCSMLRGSKKEIRIYSHDCTWFNNVDVQTSLQDARSNGITITVIAHNPEDGIVEMLTNMGISVHACKGFCGPPFCVIDKQWLFLPVQSGTLSKQFSVMRTNDKYLVDNFLSLFDTALSYSQPWRGKNV